MDDPAKSCVVKRLISGVRKSHAFCEATLKRAGQPFFNNLLSLFEFALHTYTHVVAASRFSFGFWLWALSTYVIGGVWLWLFHKPQATVGTLVLPVIMDTGTLYSAFIAPGHSTAPIELLFTPLWNIAVCVPFGGGIGWWVGKRLRETALANIESRGLWVREFCRQSSGFDSTSCSIGICSI